LRPNDLGIAVAEPLLSVVLTARQNRLVEAAGCLTLRLKHLHGAGGDKFLAVAYFDEAHTLQDTSNDEHGRNPYFYLMHVLSTIENSSIFFIFLTTNSSLTSLAPRNALYPSLRVRAGRKLIPPFFELPFDMFCRGLTTALKRGHNLTLNGVCELGQMVKFGRPM
jgi:hypothetical protein